MKRYLTSLIICFLCFLLSSQAGRAESFALIIGVDKYESREIRPLRYAGADAKALAKVLVTGLDYKPENVKLMTTDDGVEASLVPTATNIIHQLDQLSKVVKAEDTFLFYFAGHGFSRRGSNYLATNNTSLRSPAEMQLSSLSVGFLSDALEALQVRQMVLILDACRNNLKMGRPSPDDDVNDVDIEKLKGLARGKLATASLLACGQGQKAYEWHEKKQGVFTYYLLQGITTNVADTDKDTVLTATELGTYASKMVANWSQENRREDIKQVPEMMQIGNPRLILGRLKATEGPMPPPPAPDRNVARMVVTTSPPGAKVLINGVNHGPSPVPVTIELGNETTRAVQVQIVLRGYVTVVAQKTLTKDLPMGADFTLMKVEPEGPEPHQSRLNPTDLAEMIYVPAGEFLMGSNEYKNEAPLRTVHLDGYWIYENLVTVAQYRMFCQANGRRMPVAPKWGWQDDLPIVNVTWQDAMDYAKWAGVTLPTEAQWEKAARGTQGNRYPWGMDFDDAKAWTSVKFTRTAPSPVGSFPLGASPFGCLDMAGNVMQWCADGPGGFSAGGGTRVGETVPSSSSSRAKRALRGGSFQRNNTYFFRTTAPDSYAPEFSFVDVGFRCVSQTP